LELLADFASTVSASDHILDEAGVKSLAELQGDTARSGRLAGALNEKNRYIGMAQGAISGATGVAGAAADIPLSMILALRAVYLTGRAYGFELNQPEDRAMIFEALSNADLSLITEKQAILIGLNSVSGMLGTGNIQGLQTMLGSSNDFEPLFKLLSDSNGQLKWRISATLLNKVTPVIGGAVGALYTSRLLKEVSDSAKQVFEYARQHGVNQSATQQALSVEDKLVNASTPDSKEEQAAQKEAQQSLLQNEDIAKVELSTRSEHDAHQLDDDALDEKIHDQLNTLADKMVDDTQDDNAAKSADQQEGDADASGDTTAENDSTQAAKKPARTRSTKAKSTTDSSKAASAKPAGRTAQKSTGTTTDRSTTSSNAPVDHTPTGSNTKH
jgi:hypothetical protein